MIGDGNDQLILTCSFDQDRRGIGASKIETLPHDLSIRLSEGNNRGIFSSHGQDDKIAKGQGVVA